MAADLTRRSAGLTDSHRALIRLLAERAVSDYLDEVKDAETTKTDDDGVHPPLRAS